MANELTIGTETACYVSQNQGQGIVYNTFIGAAANGTATTFKAAGAALTRHIITEILVDVDTAGETLAIISGSTTVFTMRFPVPDVYHLKFEHGLEMGIAEAIVLDKGTAAAINGRIWYKAAAINGIALKA